MIAVSDLLSSIRTVWTHRPIVKALTVREVFGRYRGSFLGVLWSFVVPLLMLAIYTFVFSVVFKARWSVESESKVEFALALFSGLIVFGVFAECLNRAPTLIVSNVNYVKKVVFPLEVLPFVVIGSALFHAAVSLLVWVSAHVLFYGFVHPTVLLVPIVMIPLVLLGLGTCWLLSALGVFVRDISQFVSVLTTALMFLSPIFYPLSMLPPAYQTILRLNPLTPTIEQFRAILLHGNLPDPASLILSTATGGAVAVVGYIVFQKTRKGFADVL